MAKMKVTVNIANTELFKQFVNWTKEILEDNRMPKCIYDDYTIKLKSIIDNNYNEKECDMNAVRKQYGFTGCDCDITAR